MAGRTLQEVVLELESQNRAKADFIAPAKGMRLREDGSTFEINHLMTGEQQAFNASTILHKQIGAALNIPAKYYNLMREEKPELLSHNINSWFADMNNSFMVRSFMYPEESIGRALLSTQYRRIDNLMIAETVLSEFAGRSEYEVIETEVTERKLYFKIVNHRMEANVNVGDAVQGGVIVSNSEVGLGAVSIQPFVYRLVCSNGMVATELSNRKTHVGKVQNALENSFQIYSSDTEAAEDKALSLKIRDTIQGTLSEEVFKMAVYKLKLATEEFIDGDPAEVIRLAGKVYDFSNKEKTGILRHLVDGGDLSKYGLSNAITSTCHEIKDFDRATELQGIGWQVATMKRDLWDQINGNAYML
ncbi:MAG: DUF932 domain-containing protein [Pseudobutyrivibrio sp.]|nr:DUF932 domain-containing protein [Pseudobutyrivibrio sp.]